MSRQTLPIRSALPIQDVKIHTYNKARQHRLNIEVDLQLIGCDPATPPLPVHLYYLGRYWSTKIDDISL